MVSTASSKSRQRLKLARRPWRRWLDEGGSPEQALELLERRSTHGLPPTLRHVVESWG